MPKVSKVTVYALKSSLYFEGVPYMVGNPIELPAYMVDEWLALGLVSQEPPVPKAKEVVPGIEKPKVVKLAGTMKKEPEART